MPHGMINVSDTVLSFDDGKREFTITPTSPATTFSYWFQGVKYTKTGAQTIALTTDTDGVWKFYYVGGTLTRDQSNSLSFSEKVPICEIYWNQASQVHLDIQDERHMIVMDPSTHQYLHDTVGTRWGTGLGVSGDITGDGKDNAHAQVAVATGSIWDEDVEIKVTTPYAAGTKYSQTLASPAEIPVYYRLGTTPWKKKTTTTYPLYENGTAACFYNDLNGGDWKLTACSNADFVCSWIFGTTNIREPIICILGQRTDTSLLNAQTNNTLSGISFGTIPFQEMKLLCRIIFQTSSLYSNAVHARAREILDQRAVSTLQGGTFSLVDHSQLSGLNGSNVHPIGSIDTSLGMTISLRSR